MLFVGNDQAQPVEVGGLGDQSVGADDQIGFVGRNGRTGVPLLGCRHRAGQEGRADPELCQQGLQRAGVLLGQDLGGGHQGGLQTVFGCKPCGGCRDHGLAAAHVALHHAVHNPSAGEIGGDLPDHAPLGVRQGEGEHGFKRRKLQPGQRLAFRLSPAAAEHGQTDGEDEELLKDQPPPGGVQRLEGGRRVDLPVGRRRVAEAVLFPELRRQQLRQLADAGVQRQRHAPGEHAVAQASSQRVDRHDPTGLYARAVHGLKDGVCDLVAQIISVQRAVEIVFLAVPEAVRHVVLIEKGEIQPGRVVGHGQLGQIQPLADVGRAGVRGHEGPEAGGLIRLQLRDGNDAGPVLVGPGEVGNQIVERPDPDGSEALCTGLAHALEKADRFKQLCHALTSVRLLYAFSLLYQFFPKEQVKFGRTDAEWQCRSSGWEWWLRP